MTRANSWWHELSGPSQLRLYSRFALQFGVAVIVIVLVNTNHVGPWPVAGMVVCGLAGIAAIEAQPELAAWPSDALRRWARFGASAALTSVWLVSAVVASGTSTASVVAGARVAGICAAVLFSLSVLSFARRGVWTLAGISALSGVAFEDSWGSGLHLAARLLLYGLYFIVTTRITLWVVRVVNEAERAKNLSAELQLAEERLRFARDLHDVVGRSFSTIAVKSELAATLSRAGAAERATTEMNEVKTIAVESMNEMRQLVRGYRDIDLVSEVAGARSLLSATGCLLVVEGDPAKVPPDYHEVAAWVVREGTTNIVKHSSATSATLTLGAVGMSLRNDGAPGEPGERTGLLGLDERLTARGASLTTDTTGNDFALEIKWRTS